MPSAGAPAARHLEDNVLSYTESAAGFSAAPVAFMSNPPELSGDPLLDAVLASLDDDKAEQVVTIPLRGRSEIADFMVVCSGRSTRQVAAIADKLMDRLKQDHGVSCKAEGKETGDWVLIDAGDVIVHVFRPEVRDFYQLEKMWQAAGTGRTATA